MSTRKNIAGADYALLACFFMGGIFLKLQFWQRAEPLTLGDLYFYQGLAQAFLARDWKHFWHFHFYPVYPVLMALCHKLFATDLVRAGRFLNIIFDGLSLLPIYLIAKEIFGKRVGLLSALFWSFCWPYHRLYGDPEPIYAFFVFCGLALMLRKQAGFRNFLAAAALASFSALIKSEAVFFLGLILLLYLLRSREKALLKLAMLPLAALIYLGFTSPLWVKYYQLTGEFNPNPKSRTLLLIHNPPKDYQLWLYGLRESKEGTLYTHAQKIYIDGDKDALQTTMTEFFAANWRSFLSGSLANLKLVAGQFQLILLARIFPGALLLFPLGFIRRKPDYNWQLEPWLWVWALLFWLALSVFNPWERFFYPYFPLLAIFTAKGLERLVELSAAAYGRMFPHSDRPALKLAGRWLLPAFFIFWYLFYNFYGTSHVQPEMPEADAIRVKSQVAKMVKNSLKPDDIIMCRGFPEPLTYFLGIPFWKMLITPAAEVEDIIRYGRAEKAAFFFVEEEDLRRYPELEPWLWGKVETDALQLIMNVPKKKREQYYPYAWYKFVSPERDK